jgi:signal transduction histidine kinase
MHGGSIWAERQGENKGSTFLFTLPVSGAVERDGSSGAGLTCPQNMYHFQS